MRAGKRAAAARRLVRQTTSPVTCSPHLASHPLLIFLDADVRVSRPTRLRDSSAFMEQSGAALVSGVPARRRTTFSEKLIIPLIHFVLLGFLPIQRMRTGTDPACSAACGQILAAVARSL